MNQLDRLHTHLGQIMVGKINFESIYSDGVAYCKKTDRDLRVLYLGIRLCEGRLSSDFFRFFNLYTRITNYGNIWSEFAIVNLNNLEERTSNIEVKKVISNISGLYCRYGDNAPQDIARSAAESAAQSAWSVSRSARSVARSARSAAQSAQSAAESVAWSARSAWSVARSTRSAAQSARSAAESVVLTECVDMFETLIKIMEKRLC